MRITMTAYEDFLESAKSMSNMVGQIEASSGLYREIEESLQAQLDSVASQLLLRVPRAWPSSMTKPWLAWPRVRRRSGPVRSPGEREVAVRS